MKKNLLIGAITTYIWEDVAPFFNSYVRAGFENCDCVMFVSNMSAKTIEKIKSCGVTIYQIPERYNGKCINDYRWEIYADFLKDKRENYDMIFTADVRDTFFQHDVFKHYNSSKPFLGIALEDGKLSEPINKKWLITRYGEPIYEELKEYPIICTGTVFGTAEKFLDFSLNMTENLNSNKYNYFNVSDQAAGNFLIYHDKMFADCLVKNYNESGFIMTIGITNRENVKLDSNDNVLNGKGEIAAVVHQYDRLPDVTRKIITKYCPDINFLYYDIFMLKRPGFIWRFVRYCYRIRKIGLLKALYITVRKRLPGWKNFA